MFTFHSFWSTSLLFLQVRKYTASHLFPPFLLFIYILWYFCYIIWTILFRNVLWKTSPKDRHIYRVFRNLWHPLQELIARRKIMKNSHINICLICLHSWHTTNFINRANSSKLVLRGMVYSIFIIIIIGMKKNPHVIVHSRHQRQFSLNF